MKKQFLILFAFISVLALSQVPQRFNKVIVTGDITSPKFIKTGSNADSVLLGNGSARSVNSLKTDTVSLSNRINTKATGNGTANGTNTGDETLTSIKTKLGAATSVSDGYLKYQDWNTLNSKEPAITKKSGFNLPIGTTTGTVLEGRTFGTAANSAVGDFQPSITGLTTNYIPKWNGSSFVNSLVSDDGNKILIAKVVQINDNYQIQWSNSTSMIYGSGANGTINITGNISVNNGTASTSPTTGALVVNGGVGADHVRANNFYGNGSNLTGIQLPITLTTNGTSGAATFNGNVLNVPNYANNATGGTYSPTVTLVSGLSSNTSWGATYTKNGSNYHVGTAGVLTTNATGTCAFRFTLPYSITGTFAAIIPHIYGVSGSYIASSWSAGVNSSTVEITFTSTSPTASQFYYNIMVDYY